MTNSISSWAFDDIPEEPVAATTRPFLARLVRKISEHREAEADKRDGPTEVLSRTLHGEHLIQRRLR